jgi:hypothetical protein
VEAGVSGPVVERGEKLSTIGSLGLLAAALGTSIVVAAIVAIGVVWIWFANTRGDALAAFEISFLAAGAFSAPVAFSLFGRHRRWGMYLIALTVLPWIVLAVYATVGVCREFFITWDNWRWILKSGDQRLYELDWIIRGWQAIGIATLAGLLASRAMLKKPPMQSASSVVVH